MKTTVTSTLRSSPRLTRVIARAVIAGQLAIGTPVLAQDLTRATVLASAQAARDTTSMAQQAVSQATKQSRRVAADVRRTIAKTQVRVNRTVPTVTPPAFGLSFGVDVPTDAIRRVAIFAEPLLPSRAPTPDDNRAVAALVTALAGAEMSHRLLRIEQFLSANPASPWRASVLANAATLFQRNGYFSRAAAYWRQAWELTRDSADPHARAIADYAVGEWLTQMMMFGQVDALAQRLVEIDGRGVRGSAGAKVSAAASGLKVLRDHHDLALFSGPEALKAYLRASSTMSAAAISAVDEYHPTPAGTSLADLQGLAARHGAALTMVHGAPLAEIPVPAIVHLRSQHFSAITGRKGDAFVLTDPALGGTFTMSEAALRDEASGYFLIPGAADPQAWRTVTDGEAASVMGHCAPGNPSSFDPPCPKCGDPGPGPHGTPQYSFHPVNAALILEDVPIGYAPPVGPAMSFLLAYNHRDFRLPQTPNYGNVGPLWTFGSLSYVVDNLYCIQSPCLDAQVVLRGHGFEGYDQLGAPHGLSRATLVQVAYDPPRYERRLPDGTVEVFTQPDRAATEYSRRILLTALIDPQGHTLSYTYDSSLRMVAITDALGQVTTLAYAHGADPLLLTTVTDPFGRVASLGYDAAGRLASITDAAGMVSTFSYGPGDFIVAMTTPYGTTSFRHEGPVGHQMIEAIDPVGGRERLEFQFENTALAQTEPSKLVPTGFTNSNLNLHRYNSVYWDKLAMARHPGDVTQATITSWMFHHDDGEHHHLSHNVPHSIKKPLENRVWYRYEGQTTSSRSVNYGRQPTLIGRVLDDGSSQVTQMTYNSKGMVTSRIDPLGRQTNYTYATNGLDLLTIEQVRSGGTDVIQSYSNYNTQHLPGTITDAAGQDTDMTYNSAGQPLTLTNAKNETTTYTYETGTNHLLTVTGPVSGATTTYTYDAYGRVESVEDADGYVVVTDYDHLNRVTQRTYPDDTTETNTYARLDLTQQKDRLGRITRHFYDGFGRMLATRDPAGRTISQVWCDCGALDALVDANGNQTKWERDIQGRVMREIRADTTTDTLYTYDLAGRLKTITDPKDQVTTHSYNLDDSLSGTAYTNEEIETPNIAYTYDAYYSRVATMVDGIGTTAYTYKAPSTNGAGQIATVDGPLSNDTIAYTYDELGRVVQRTINGSANQVDWTFDTLGRVTSEENLLGEFTYAYDGVTNRLATVTYPNGQTSAYSYLDDESDHRLETIHHRYPNTSTLSKFDYTYDARGNILTWRQQADSTAVLWKYGYDPADQLVAAVKHATDTPQTVLQRFAYAYDPAGNRTVEQIDDQVTLAAYDNLNRLTSQVPGGPMVIAGTLNEPGTVTISGKPAMVDASNNFRGTVPTTTGTNTFTIVARDASGNTTTQQYELELTGPAKTFTFDANGNLTSDGTRTFDWDARNQLVSVDVGTHRSEFTYDGQRRRIRAIEKENSVVQSDAKVLWCVVGICEERGADGVTVSRRPFGGGEQIGSALRFHATDHLGSVIGVTDGSVTVLSRLAYDPWGRRSLTAGTDVTDGGYAEQEWHSETNLSFTLHRAYDPELGRWTSEDPSGLRAGPNLYTYANGLPTVLTDPSGLVAVEQHQLRIIPVSWRDVPTNEPGEVACGAVDSNFDLGGKCECVNGRYYPRLWLKYAPVMYIATDAKTPAKDIIKHEFTHHDINRGIVQAAVAEGTALEGRGFDSEDQCKFRIQFWVDKWKANRGKANRNFDRWERFFGVGCQVQ